jgi:hypothetical protein
MFTPSAYLANTKSTKCCRSPIAALYFLIILAVPLALGSIATAGSFESIGNMKGGLWIFVVVIPLVLAMIELLAALGLPSQFMLRGMWGAAGVGLVATVVAALWRAYLGVAFFVVLGVFTVFFWIWMRPGEGLAVQMLRYSRRFVFSGPVFGVLLLSCGLVAALAAIHVYVAMVKWAPGVYVLLVYTFWVLALVVGEVLYQYIGQVVAAWIFVGPRSSEPRQWSHLAMIGRACVANLGVAAFNATVLPFLDFIYAIAHVDQSEVGERLQFVPPLARCVEAIYGPLHRLAVSLCKFFDRVLGAPTRRAAVYSAMFGIPRQAAAWRVAETESKYFTSILNVNCYIDYLVAFVGLLMTITYASVGWGYGRRSSGAEALLGCAFGGLSIFGFFNLVRMLLLGITDATFICYFENPLVFPDTETEEKLRAEYNAGVTRKVYLTIHRRSNRGYASILE